METCGRWSREYIKTASQEFFNWLDEEVHCELRYGKEEKITMSEKQILITQWCGNLNTDYSQQSATIFSGVF